MKDVIEKLDVEIPDEIGRWFHRIEVTREFFTAIACHAFLCQREGWIGRWVRGFQWTQDSVPEKKSTCTCVTATVHLPEQCAPIPSSNMGSSEANTLLCRGTAPRATAIDHRSNLLAATSSTKASREASPAVSRISCRGDLTDEVHCSGDYLHRGCPRDTAPRRLGDHTARKLAKRRSWFPYVVRSSHARSGPSHRHPSCASFQASGSSSDPELVLPPLSLTSSRVIPRSSRAFLPPRPALDRERFVQSTTDLTGAARGGVPSGGLVLSVQEVDRVSLRGVQSHLSQLSDICSHDPPRIHISYAVLRIGVICCSHFANIRLTLAAHHTPGREETCRWRICLFRVFHHGDMQVVFQGGRGRRRKPPKSTRDSPSS